MAIKYNIYIYFYILYNIIIYTIWLCMNKILSLDGAVPVYNLYDKYNNYYYDIIYIHI